MIRFVFRFVGILLLALGFIFLVYDGAKSMADHRLSFMTVADAWSNIHQNSLSALQPAVERLIGTPLWRGIVERYFLDQPVSLVLAIVAALFILIGRKKKPLIGYGRD
jgi:hypothetical protein